jgi:hypothetical protein
MLTTDETSLRTADRRSALAPILGNMALGCFIVSESIYKLYAIDDMLNAGQWEILDPRDGCRRERRKQLQRHSCCEACNYKLSIMARAAAELPRPSVPHAINSDQPRSRHGDDAHVFFGTRAESVAQTYRRSCWLGRVLLRSS